MIIAYTGLPGGGKSLSALDDYILPALRAGRHVFSNIVGLDPLRIANLLGQNTPYINRFLHRFEIYFDPEVLDSAKRGKYKKVDINSNLKKQRDKTGLVTYYNLEGMDLLLDDVMSYKEALFVVDECHEYLSPDNWLLLGKLKKYLSMARHYGHDILLITQHIDDIWPPLKNRVHETHNFVRGSYGSKNQYIEQVYHGWNVARDPAFTKNRLNNKTLYALYASHDNGAKEHLKYISIWQNKKLVALLGGGVLLLVVGITSVINKGGPAGLIATKGIQTQLEDPKKYDSSKNIVFVKYVVCDAYQCKAVLPDGKIMLLPLDYDSGKYPLQIKRVHRENSNRGSVSSLVPGG